MAAGNYLGAKSEIEYEETKGKDVDHEGSPFKHGLITFISFNLAGLIPLIPFLMKVGSPFVLSTIFVGLTLFLIGFLRTIYTKQNLIKSGAEMFTIGGLAAFVAFIVGYLVKGLVG